MQFVAEIPDAYVEGESGLVWDGANNIFHQRHHFFERPMLGSSKPMPQYRPDKNETDDYVCSPGHSCCASCLMFNRARSKHMISEDDFIIVLYRHNNVFDASKHLHETCISRIDLENESLLALILSHLQTAIRSARNFSNHLNICLGGNQSYLAMLYSQFRRTRDRSNLLNVDA